MIKSFENFTGSKIGKARLLPFKVQSVIDQIDLFELANNIYAVKVEDIKIRCYLFLRYQEFYEGFSSKIRNSRFTIDEYIKWYQDHYKNKEMFTYAYDWCGFNIPSTSIEECLDFIVDKNEYDRIMFRIFNLLKMENDGKDFYLLGVDSLGSDLLEHEMAHGMYFTDTDYKLRMDELTNSLPSNLYSDLSNIISEFGYADIVIDDEIQAYMSTGLADKMSSILNVGDYITKYRNIFDQYLRKNRHPKEIKVDW